MIAFLKQKFAALREHTPAAKPSLTPKEEIARLQSTDHKYAKKGEKTAKLWLAQKYEALLTNTPDSTTTYFDAVKQMKRSHFFNAKSASRAPVIQELLQNCNRENRVFDQLTKAVEEEIARLEKDDVKYTDGNGETLKLSLFRSFLASLKQPKSRSQKIALLGCSLERRRFPRGSYNIVLGSSAEQIQQELNMLYSMHRSDGQNGFTPIQQATAPAASTTTHFSFFWTTIHKESSENKPVNNQEPPRQTWREELCKQRLQVLEQMCPKL